MSPDDRIAIVTSKQFGLAQGEQLRAAGMSRSSISWRARHKRLYRIHAGVYAVGHDVLSHEARLMAAVLATAPDSAVGYRSAADLWNITRRRSGEVHVIVPRRHRRVSGIHVHETRWLSRSQVTLLNGIPVTTVARTIVDLADQLTVEQVVNLMHEAAFRRRLNLRRLRQAMDHGASRRGAPTIRAALHAHLSGSAGAMSELEVEVISRLKAVMRDDEMANMLVNVRVHDVVGKPIRPDLLWPDRRLCVEIDGHGHDRARTSLDDAERDRRLRDAGYRVVRLPLPVLHAGTELERRVLAALRNP